MDEWPQGLPVARGRRREAARRKDGCGPLGEGSLSVPGWDPAVLFGQLLESAPDAIVAAGRDGRIVLVNSQTERLFGYPRESLIGEPVEILVPQHLREGHGEQRRAYFASPRPRPMGAHMELRGRRCDGREFPVQISLSTIDTDAGRLVIAAIRDVTEEHELRNDLAASEELLRTAIDYAPVGVALVTPAGRFIRVNRELCDMTGYAEGELLSMTAPELTHPDDVDADLDQSRQLLAGEIASYEVEKRYWRADGSLIWILLSVAVVRDRDGQPMHLVAQIQDISDRKRYEDELRHLAEHDTLTGLKNRRAFAHELTRQLASHARYGEGLALLMIDLDHFKYINDTLGHHTGDQVIRAVATALGERLRTSDTLARLGGDEFAIILPNSDRETAEPVAGNLLATIRDLRVDAPEREVRVCASIGIVVVDDDDELDENAILAAADLAMYEAKDDGRDRYVVHDIENGSLTRASARLDWSDRIRRALQHDLFVMHYQPIVDLADRSSNTYEALIRIADEPGEPIGPDVFLYIADRYGLMPAIDRWVIREVITTLASDKLPTGANVSLNISPRSLTDPGILDLIERLIAEHHIDPRRLTFEVTETAAIARIDEAQRFGRRLKRLGCSFALDDFGTGFGSFSHLKHLPYDTIKIDGDFVRGMTHNPNDRLLVEALVHVAQGMHKKTVAEYVSDEQTIALLRELGVDYAQGHYLGRPTPTEALCHA